MSVFVPVALFGWIPVVALLFLLLPSRRAVLVAYLAGWLLLPMAGYDFKGLPDYTKDSATFLGVLLGVLLFDAGRFSQFRLHWFDVPMLVWCAAPLGSSLSNGLGLHDGLSATLTQFVIWGCPYLMGRLYFRDLSTARELVMGVLLGGLAYVPLCLYEVRMSPQLHSMLYGFHQHSFALHARYGGFRPMVFLASGLVVAAWMAFTCVVAFWLWRNGSVRRLWSVPMAGVVGLMVLTLVLCKSMGPIVLFVAGVASLYLMRHLRTKAVIAVLALVPPMYTMTRASGLWSGSQLLDLTSKVDTDRTGSLECRILNENALIDRAMERPLLGWGGWGRNRVIDEFGQDTSLTDGLWIIALGSYGLCGLTAILGVFLAPVLLLLWRWPAAWLLHRDAAYVQAALMVVCLAAINNLPNADSSPAITLLAGSIGSLAMLRVRRPLPAPRNRAAARPNIEPLWVQARHG